MQDNFCIKSSAIWQFVGYGLFALKIIIPLIIIIMGIMDFSKATISNDDKALPTALSTLVRRLVMGIAIFFIPTVVSLVISLVSQAAEMKEKIDGCQTCLLRPTSQDCKNSIEQAKSTRI